MTATTKGAAAGITGRRVLLASPRSLCAGVERAIETVERALEVAEGPVYVRRQIVHNSHVIADLQARGAVFIEELDQIPDPPPDGTMVVFSAHGVSPQVRAEADARGLTVIDGTCPLVAKVHAEARRHTARGDRVVLIGHADHEEVIGTLGEAPEGIELVESVQDVVALPIGEQERVSYLTQTTLAVDETTEVIDALQRRFPNLAGPGSDDICYATTNRQQALAQVAGRADLVLVVGSANSSNSLRLVELARKAGTQAHLIDDAGDIDPTWLDGVSVIGVTAGASAPQPLVDEVIEWLRGIGPLEVREHELTRETVTFAPPAIVRSRPGGTRS